MSKKKILGRNYSSVVSLRLFDWQSHGCVGESTSLLVSLHGKNVCDPVLEECNDCRGFLYKHKETERNISVTADNTKPQEHSVFSQKRFTCWCIFGIMHQNLLPSPRMYVSKPLTRQILSFYSLLLEEYI